jgi:hypothetical protein
MAGICLVYFIITFRSRWNWAVYNNDQLNSFAGCGRDNHDSYKYKTNEEINKILKMWDISKEEFEERKKKCEKKL